MSIQKFFNSIGLNEKTQKVYMTLLKLADAPANDIARKSGIERTTTYHQLEYLIKLGLISSYRHKNIRRFVAENPNKIKGMLEGKIALFEKYLPDIENIFRGSGGDKFIKLRLFEGKEGVQQISEEELGCKEKMVRSIGSSQDLRKAGNGKITFTNRRVEKKIFAKCLRPENDIFSKGWIESQEKELREVRLLPASMKLSGMIFIYDDKVALISPEEEGLGFIITSKSFSASMKMIFDIIWETSKKTKY